MALEVKKARFNPFVLPSDFFEVRWGPCLPVDGSVGGCGARAVSRKTPIYFIVLLPLLSRGSIGGEKNIFLIGSVIHEVEGLLMAPPLMDDTPLLTHTISLSLGNSKVAPNLNIFIIYKAMSLQ